MFAEMLRQATSTALDSKRHATMAPTTIERRSSDTPQECAPSIPIPRQTHQRRRPTPFRLQLLAATIGLICTGGASSALAGPVGTVDQQQTIDNGSNALAGPRWQTFVPTLSGLDFVEVKLGGSGLTDGVQETLQIHIHDGGPTGTILGSSDQVVLADAFSTSIVHFDFPAIVSLTPGNNYAIQLLQLSPDDTTKTVRLGLSDPYSGGAYYTSPDEPSFPGTSDMYFREGLHVPEPSSIALAALGAVGAIAWRRNRGRRLRKAP